MSSDAEHHQANKDSEDDWEEAPAPRRRSERRRLGAMVSVRFSAEEADRLRADADGAGLSLSRYIRDLVLKTAHGPVIPPSITVGSPAGAQEPPTPVALTSPIRVESHSTGSRSTGRAA
jgi:hypothetical protein